MSHYPLEGINSTFSHAYILRGVTGSERNPLEMRVVITWIRFQPGLKILPGFRNRAGIFSLGKRAENRPFSLVHFVFPIQIM